MPYYRKEDGSLVEVYDQPSVGQVMSDTSGYSPDDVAEIKTLSKKLKVSPEIVRMNKPLAQRIAAAPDLSILDNTAPVLAGMSRDHGFMSLASDDMYNLARIEQKNDEVRRARQADDNKKATEVINKMTFNWVPDFVKNTDAFREFASGQAVDRVGMIATLQKELKDKGQDLNPQQKQYLKDMQTAAKYDTQKTGFGSWVASASEIVGQMYEGATSPNKNPFALATASGLAAAGTAAMLSGPTAPITVPAAGAAGFASGMRAGMFMRAKAVEGGNAYLELLDLKDENGKPVPVDDKTARVASEMVGVINGSLELVGFEHAAKLVPGLNEVMKNGAMDLVKKNPTVRKAFLDYAKKVAGATAAETATESTQELTNIFTEGFMQDKSVVDVIKDPETAERVKGIMEKVAKGTLLLGGMGGSVDLYNNVRTAQKYQKAVQVHEALMDTMTATEQSLLSKRSKEDLADFMQRKADRDGNEFIYLQADRVIDEATKAGMSPDEITSWLDQYGVKKTDLDAAIERGGNITLEYGKTMAGIKDDEVLVNLKNDLMVDPEISPVSTAVEDALAENNTMQRLTELYQAEQDRMVTADDLDMWEKDILNQPGLKGKVTRDSLSLLIARSNMLAKLTGNKAVDHLNRMLMPDGLRAMKFADFAAEQQAMRDANGQPMMQMTHDFEQEGNYTFNEAEHRAPVMGWAKQQFGEAVAPNGKPAWQNFTNWFGDSKVVDADGKPLVVYHGTDRNFTKFSKKQRGLAYYFTANPDQAASYAGTKNANVMPVYIKSENLYRGGKESELLEAIKDGDDYYPYSISKIKEWMRDQNPAIFHIPSAIKALKRMGYDGFVEVENGVEQFGVFSPNQIKSATGNQGNFSPTDASILNQSAYSFSTNTRPYGFAGMSERAQKIADSLSDIIAVGDGTIAPDVLYSSRTWTVDEKSQIKELAKQMGIAEDKVDKWLYDIDNAMARVLADPSLDFIAEAADLYSALKPNSDPHYTVSLDFSTLCRKRYELVATIEAIQNRIGKAVTKELWVDIRQMLDDMGYNVSCGACYVDSKRMEAGKFINKFIDEHPEEDPRQFLSQAGIDQLKRDNPKLYAEFKKAIGSNNAKTPESRTDYHGEIRWYFLEGRDFDNKETKNTGLDAWTKNKNAARGKKRVEAMNKKSGLRWQSWSDFEVPHLMDAMQAILDMHMAGLMGHAYTKVPDFVLAMGKTGLMVNMSLIPKGTGLASDGTLIFDSKEGMPFDIALQLRDANEMTAGTIAIGVNNDHISAMLKDPRIDYVIPYHASGLSKDIAKRFNMDGWEDYTDTQTEDIKDYELFHKMIGKKDDKLVRMMLKVTDPAAWVKAETKYAKAEIVKTKEPKLTKSGSPSKKQLTEAEIKKKVTALNNYLAELEAYGESVSNMSNEELAAERVKSIAAYRKAAKASGAVSIDTTEYWDDTKSGDENAKLYLALAESRGVLPKFRGKEYSNGKVLRDFTQEPGYWKLLIDRKMYDHSGNNIVQEAVKPEYDEAAIKDIFDRASGNPTPDAAAADVVNHFSQKEGYTGPLMQSFAGMPQRAGELADGTTTIDVDGVERPALNSNDQPIHWSEEGIRNFWRWFGDSKVVDEQGRPLVVYHGTTSSFDSFDPKMNGSVTRATSSKSGFFFTSSPRTAQSYADHGAIVTPVEQLIAEAEKAGDRGKWDLYDEKINEAEQLEAELADPANRGRGKNLIPAYLTLKNPLVFDANGENPSGIGGIDRLIQKAKKDGHDGVIIKNFDDAAGISNDNADHYIAFSPTQIKSVFNRGTFDPNNPNMLMQSAWHGSPHTFDKFSTSAIGTGEGAQAYGYGLYFAGAKDVAEWYRDKLAGQQSTLIIDGQEFGNTQQEYSQAADVDRLIMDAYIGIGKGYKSKKQLVAELKSRAKGAFKNWKPIFKEAIAKAQTDAVDINTEKGKLYKVELAPAEDEYLLWDKPLSEQSEKVREALDKIENPEGDVDQLSDDDLLIALGGLRRTIGKEKTGQGLYKELGSLKGSDKAASEYLHSLGIRGIKYLDGNSRSGKKEDYNYVIFSDDDVEIQEMYQRQQQQNDNKTAYYGALTRPDGKNLITLFEKSDKSTFLHETGHIFLNDIKYMAENEGIDVELWNEIKEWLGVGEDGVLTRAMHEKWAEHFEVYLMEGKAPTIGLRDAFRQFKSWLTKIYEVLTSKRFGQREDINIDPDIRAIFDRTLATDLEIKQAQEQSAMLAMLNDELLRSTGFTQEQLDEYRKVAIATDDAAREKRDKHKLVGLKDRLAGWREDAEREARAVPVYAFIDWMKDIGVSRQSIVDNFGDEGIPKSLPMFKADGMTLEHAIAQHGQQFGYESAGEFISEFRNMQPVSKFIEKRVAQKESDYFNEQDTQDAIRTASLRKLLEMESEWLASQIERDAAKQAKNEEEYNRVWQEAEQKLAIAITEGKMQAEIDKLRDAARQAKADRDAAFREQRQKDKPIWVHGRQVTKRDILRGWAEKTIAKRTIKEIFDTRSLIAESRKNRQSAIKYAKEQNWRAALEANEKARMVEELLAASLRARDKYNKMLRKWNRAVNSKSINYDYHQQLMRLLVEYQATNRKLDINAETPSFLQFMEKMNLAAGDDIDVLGLPAVPAFMGEEVTPLAEMNWEQIQDFSDMMAFLEGRGRDVQDALLADGVTRVTEARDAALQSSESVKRNQLANLRKQGTMLRKAQDFVSGYLARNQILLFTMRAMDGETNVGKNGVAGNNESLIWRPLMDGINKKLQLKEKINAILNPHMEQLIKRSNEEFGKLPLPDQFKRYGYTWTWERVVAVALNRGNDSNLQRLMGGFTYNGQQMTMEHVDEILSNLTAEDWKSIQGIWDGINTLYPELNEVHKKINFFPMKKIPAQAFTVTLDDESTMDLPGGYYPVRFDPVIDKEIGQWTEKDDLLNRVESLRQVPAAKSGMTKSREQGNVQRPLKLQLSVLGEHVEDTINYTALAQPVRDADRITKNNEYAMRAEEILGIEGQLMIRAHLKGIIRPEQMPKNEVERWIEKSRTLMSAYAMAYNLWTALQNFFGVFPLLFDVGVTNFMNGAATVTKDPITAYKTMIEMSPYMKNRMDNVDRDIRKHTKNFKPQFEVKGMTVEDIRDAGFWGIKAVDMMNAMPAWWGAYNKALETMDNEEAIKFADTKIQSSQGSGLPIDLSDHQRAQGLMRFFTNFMTFAITQQNIMAQHVRAMREGKITKGEYAYGVLMTLILPAVATTILKAAVTKGEPPEPKEIAGDLISYGFMGFPFLRDVVSASTNKVFKKGYNHTGLRMASLETTKVLTDFFGDSLKLGESIINGEDREKYLYRTMWDAAIVASMASGIPASTLYRKWERGKKQIEEANGHWWNLLIPDPDVKVKVEELFD